MALCPNCGASVADNAPSCPACGIAFQPNPAPYPNQQPYPQQQPVYAQPPVYVQQPQAPATSVGGWFGWLLLVYLLPLIGLIIMRIAAQDQSAKNFATCMLILQLIALVLVLLLLIFSASVIGSL